MTNKPLINIFNNKRKIFLFCRDKNGKLFIEEDNTFFPYFYQPDTIDGKFKAYTGEKLRKVFVSNPADIRKQRSANSWEADIRFTKKYMIDKIDKLEKCPVKIAWIDLEIQSDVFPDPNLAEYPISCISVGNSFTRTIKSFFLPNYKSEFEMLDDFIKYMKQEQFDLMTGWNLVKFDYPYMFNRIPDFAEKIGYKGHVRYGGRDIIYPAGISIVDYMVLYKIIFKGLADYSLDNVLKHEFGVGKKYNKVDFSKLTDDVKLRNIDDVRGMIKIDEKHEIINHFNEIRIFTKVDWEDFIYNSRSIDMLLLEEAKHKKVVLPMKPVKEEGKKKEKFEQAYREIFEKGRLENIGKYDLAGAYLNAIIDLNLDTANIIEKNDNAIPVNVTDRETQKIIKTCFIKQDSNTLLPSIAKKLLDEKNKLKKLKNNTNPESPEYKSIEKKYEAMKALVLSAWGVIGNEYFRCYDIRVASMITSTVRDIIHYVEDELKKRNYAIVYIDTDGIMCRDNGEDISDLLNELVQKWSQERFGKSSSIEFDFEGRFNPIILLAMCRYKGWLETPKKKLKIETKGIEAKRKDSSVFMKRFQIELLDKIKENYTKEHIINWIKKEIKNLPYESLLDISFPCKLARKPEDYSNTPIFLRALQNSTITKRVGEPYHYIFIKPESYEMKTVTKELIMTYDKDGNEKEFKNLTDKRLITACKFGLGEDFIELDKIDDIMQEQLVEKKLMKTVKIEVQGKAKDVVAFDESTIEQIKGKVDWQKIIQRNIIMKLSTIFEAMSWDINEINSDYIKKIEIKSDKDEVAEYIKEMKKEDNKCEHSVKGSTLGFQPKSDGSNPFVRSNYERIQEEKSKTKIIENFDLKDLEIRKIDFQEAKKYIKENHYSHTIASSVKLALGFYYKEELVTAIVYGCPVGRRVTQWLQIERENCVELIRLFSKDGLPPNTESYCIGKSFKYIKENMPNLKYLISYADPNHGHVGYIYQATNWRYVGVQRRLLPERRIFIDGKETHARSLNAKHGSTSKKKLEEIYGDRLEIKSALKKHVYLMCLGNKKERRSWYKKFPEKPYPKIKEDTND